MSGDWEGNRRSGVALAMRHRLKWFIHLRAQGPSKEISTPANTPYGVWYFALYLFYRRIKVSEAGARSCGYEMACRTGVNTNWLS